MSDAKKVCDRVWETIESGKLEQLAEVVGADCDFKMPGMAFKGVEALRQLLSGYLTAFPDLRHHVRHFVESGDSIALELEVSGTHTGPMQTPQGAVPATGKRVVWDSCDVVHVRGGKVASWHVYHDTVPLLTALGVFPAQG
jgi:ketosteroid isomerase-like protein